MDKFILPVIPPVWWTWHERWRSAQDRLAEMLESRAFHTFIIILVVLDLGIVITELVLSTTYCDKEEMPEEAHTAEVCLRWVSIGILIFMTVELALKLLVFGPAYYTTSWFHTLDVVIVVSSLVLELALHGVAQEVAALLVFFRLWRIIRIMHSVAEALQLTHEEELSKHHREMTSQGKELASLRLRVAELEKENAALRGGTGDAVVGGSQQDEGEEEKLAASQHHHHHNHLHWPWKKHA